MAHAYVRTGEATRARVGTARPLGGVPLRQMVADVLRGKYWGGVITMREAKHEDYVFEGLAV